MNAPALIGGQSAIEGFVRALGPILADHWWRVDVDDALDYLSQPHQPTHIRDLVRDWPQEARILAAHALADPRIHPLRSVPWVLATPDPALTAWAIEKVRQRHPDADSSGLAALLLREAPAEVVRAVVEDFEGAVGACAVLIAARSL